MTLHTAQHLLSAVLDTYGLPTLSWAMHAHPSLETPYVELQRQLTWKEAEEVETKCNALIAEAKKIWIEVSVQSRSEEGQVQSADDERESRGLPKDYAGVSPLTILLIGHRVSRHIALAMTDDAGSCTPLLYRRHGPERVLWNPTSAPRHVHLPARHSPFSRFR